MKNLTLEERLSINFTEINKLIDTYLSNPDKDMAILEEEVKKICDYINTDTTLHQSNTTIKQNLEKLIDKIRQLAETVQTQLQKFNTVQRGYKAYIKTIIHDTQNDKK